MSQNTTTEAPKLHCCYLNCTSDPKWLIVDDKPDTPSHDAQLHSCDWHLHALLSPDNRNIVERL